jgi:hypothetical protein
MEGEGASGYGRGLFLFHLSVLRDKTCKGFPYSLSSAGPNLVHM